MAFLLWYPYMLAMMMLAGKIVTFSFLIAPIVHKTLEKDQAVKLLKVFFPRYYKRINACPDSGSRGAYSKNFD